MYNAQHKKGGLLRYTRYSAFVVEANIMTIFDNRGGPLKQPLADLSSNSKPLKKIDVGL